MANVTTTLPSSIPGPRGAFPLGSVADIRRDSVGFFVNLARNYGDVARFRAGFRTYYVANHPDDVRHVLQDNHRNYDKALRNYRIVATIGGNGLLTNPGGESWLTQRRLMAPAFHRERIMTLGAVMTQAAAELLGRWDNLPAGATVEMAEEMSRLTLDIVGRSLFGSDLRGETESVQEAFGVANQEVNRRVLSVVTLPLWAPVPGNRRLSAAVTRLHQVVDGVIHRRRGTDVGGNDLLSMLLEARDADTGKGMDDRQLRDEVTTLMLAGHETTAVALTWTWYLLAHHPEAAERLRLELRDALGGRAASVVDLGRLPYTRAVLQESMRLYPPAWVFSRRAIGADTLSGHPIPAGSVVIISPYVVHRHPAFWPDPEAFRPERFLASEGRHPGSYIPFAWGPRQCIGSDFAMTEGVLILAAVAQRYRPQLVTQAPAQLDPLITLRPRGDVPMRLERVA